MVEAVRAAVDNGTFGYGYDGAGYRAAVAWWLLRDHDINYYLANRPPEFLAAAAAIGLIVAGLLALLIPRLVSWSLVLPLVLFEGLASGCRVIATELSGFNEIFGNANSDTIDLIQLPPLETIDRPYQKDEADLENVLCQSILNMMTAVKKYPDVVDPQASAQPPGRHRPENQAVRNHRRPRPRPPRPPPPPPRPNPLATIPPRMRMARLARGCRP